ncbi:MAG: undecaprenyl-diphosphate phosphatase [Lachnospiraceae bacterium]|jgi:undecaprenyl-diphosphatase|nr:undecaprenyl-diphosphate phosphatase [Lachnospiraceae bacterium]MBR7015728.1 undecaprenyl-diphosphate phosphatase [Lachnospiraceae bacterium]MEE3437320.1 undecaprenyl-diphosphate phosphatase [Lachnospiraceae bacterium]MEE3456542.1 undecaprenyl-diphosphate phosphatase [Lachnospiraceae bacterium]
MPDIIKVIILGIVEGITEWLPISSTGHMILVENFLRLSVSESYWNMFLVVIQLGAILAVVFLYFPRLWPFTGVKEKESGVFKVLDRSKFFMWLKILVSCLPAIVIGLPFDDWLDEHFYNAVTVAAMLILYGILFIVVEKRNAGKKAVIGSIDRIDWTTALLIGVFQCLALIPGTSRSGATILGGIVLGMSRKTASEYTFFLAIPVMLGASLLKLVKFGFAFSGYELLLLAVGMAVAFVVSIFAIRFLMKYIRTHDFKAFGIYRIVLGVIVLAASFAGVMA